MWFNFHKNNHIFQNHIKYWNTCDLKVCQQWNIYDPINQVLKENSPLSYILKQRRILKYVINWSWTLKYVIKWGMW